MTIAVRKITDQSISEFVNNATESLDFLTEDDMRCRLFSILQRNLTTLAEGNTLSIHSEVRWYGDARGRQRPLKFRSDLVIVDQTTLREDNVFFRAPSKGYGFNEYYGIIELKLRRRNGHSDNAFLEMIRADIDKLTEINDVTSPIHNPLFHMLIFDKKHNLRTSLPYAPDGINLVYKYFDASETRPNNASL